MKPEAEPHSCSPGCSAVQSIHLCAPSQVVAGWVRHGRANLALCTWGASGHAELHSALSLLWVRPCRVDLALHDLDAAVEADPHSALSYNARGVLRQVSPAWH